MWFLKGGVRRGAFAAYLDIDHGDIEEFLNIKEIGSPDSEFVYRSLCSRLLDARYD